MKDRLGRQLSILDEVLITQNNHLIFAKITRPSLYDENGIWTTEGYRSQIQTIKIPKVEPA